MPHRKHWILHAPRISAPMALVYTAGSGIRVTRIMAFTAKRRDVEALPAPAQVSLWRTEGRNWREWLIPTVKIQVHAPHADEDGRFLGSTSVVAIDPPTKQVIVHQAYLAGGRRVFPDVSGLSAIDLMLNGADTVWHSPDVGCDVIVPPRSLFNQVALQITNGNSFDHDLKILIVEENE